jgi:uncharacterized BrkB/YihY/UPF0761 family membrane protein
VPVLAGLLAINAGLYFASFALLTAKAEGPRGLLPGAILAAVGFTALITVGTGLMTHQLKNASATYGAFGTVIGIVAFPATTWKLAPIAAGRDSASSKACATSSACTLARSRS